MATIAELDETVWAARGAGCKRLVLPKCTSSHPAAAESTNIATVPNMRHMFNCVFGWSDHAMGVGVSVASMALGATVIEKHFALARQDDSVVSRFSLEPADITQLVAETERV